MVTAGRERRGALMDGESPLPYQFEELAASLGALRASVDVLKHDISLFGNRGAREPR